MLELSLHRAARIAPFILALAGCSGNLDAAMWECQLDVQKGNAGKSAEAKAERGRAIEACMLERGYHLDGSKSSCQPGSVTSACYRKK